MSVDPRKEIYMIAAGVPVGSLAYSGMVVNRARELTVMSQAATSCDELRVPWTMKFGSFDDLVQLTSVLARYDDKVYEVFRIVDRTLRDLAPNTPTVVRYQFSEMPVSQFVRQFEWDTAKFPLTRVLSENLESMMMAVQKHSDDVRAKSFAYNEVRNLLIKLDSRRDLPYPQADLLDVLTPMVLEEDDLIETEHLTTLVVSIAPGGETEWINAYESFQEGFVVPRSSRPFARVAADKDGNKLYRVVVFRSVADSFIDDVKHSSLKVVVRKFSYSEEAFDHVVKARAQAASEKSRQETFLAQMCSAALSDVIINWMHIKVARCFVECMLRYGVDANPAAVVVKVGTRSGSEQTITDAFRSIFFIDGQYEQEVTNVPAELHADIGSSLPFVCLPNWVMN